MNAPFQRLSVAQALQAAYQHQCAGRAGEAESLYRKVLEVSPQQPDALHLLGVLMQGAGRPEAAQLIRRAIVVEPGRAVFHSSLGDALLAQEPAAAVGSYQRALELDPHLGDAWNNLGVAFNRLGNHAEAEACFEKFVALFPQQPRGHFNLGQSLHRRGALAAATQCFEAALALQPDFADALCDLGNARREQGRPDEAIDHFNRALAISPGHIAARHNLGLTLQDIGRFEEAAQCHRHAIALAPAFAEACFNLGAACFALQDFDAAIEACRDTIRLQPGFAPAHALLGNAFREQRRFDEAIASLMKARELDPRSAPFENDIGLTLYLFGRLEEAATRFRRATEIDSRFAEAHSNLGLALRDQGKLEDAAVSIKTAIAANPRLAPAHNNLGFVLASLGRLEAAVASYRHAIDLDPAYAEAWSNLGIALRDMGRLDESVASFRRALEVNPGFMMAHSNLLFAMQFDHRHTPAQLFEAHLAYAHRLKSQHPVAHLRAALQRSGADPARRLKIGYVSADFRHHSVAFFVEPVLANHARSGFEIFCYSNHPRRDRVTERIAAHADHFVPCAAMTDAQLEERIRRDRIDILVDLSGHTGGNRLPLFARRPAPVQVTWLGYSDTTGLAEVDYRISDPFTSPVAEGGIFNTEQIVRLPHTFLCYRPPPQAPEPQATPALANGFTTFGSFNYVAKVSDPVVALWARILHALPTARLILKNRSLGEGSVRDGLHRRFSAQGIAGGRVLLWSADADVGSHLDQYREIDIALDTFPYSGGTTSCEALWMGVPLIALAGTTYASRMGVSILSNAGHPEWVAPDADAYVQKAVALAADPLALDAIRRNLRNDVGRSNLADEAVFTRDLERAYRDMWIAWCQTGNSDG